MDERREALLVGSHEAAEQLLRDYETSRTPFVLYLRKFNIDVLHGPDEHSRSFIEDTLLDDLPTGVGILTVLGDIPCRATPREILGRTPALWLGDDDEWQDVLEPIIGAAEMIVSEFTFLSDGVRWELEKCCKSGKALQTVLIVPPMNSPFACVDHMEPLDQFTRITWANQLFTERISESFVASDLIKRLRTIAGLSSQDRRELYRTGEMAARLPLSSISLRSGYKERLNQRQIELALSEPDAATYHYQFWDWYRLASVLGCLHRIEDYPMEEMAFDLAYAYIEVLQGIAHGMVPSEEEGSFINDDLQVKLATTVYTLIKRYPERVATLENYARATFDRLHIECDWDS